IFKAVITVFLTNGLTEAVIAAIVTSLVAPPLYKLSKN
ncbi:ECF transporter S component, partial [Butyricicoccus sp. 1XD8-22]